MSRKALVYYQDQLAGYLTETDEGYTFIYDGTYLQSKNAMPVSFTLPLQNQSFESKTLFPFFDGLIPEGWLLNVGKNYWKLKGNDRFELLLTLCRDTIGAVSILPAEEVADV
ncbi:HipA N-terminal domain-containing protein [Algoriphagus confluentis]|uniref:HipA N-terminal domain-containing protein n=1 Tax=Algoriphagus confluentis TaxID=1697556 RepID=A0ABQ6PMI9_9BACT|nr:HipA N-terminal domain-containing protein [Algoriphagus confluentis]